jgi:calcium/calmodulin-dependent protein kinase I
VLLCGYSPFRAQGTAELIAETKSARIEFHERYWASISDAAKDFVRALLVADPARRPTAADALQHAWLTGTARTDHDLAGLREHFDPRARWASAISAVRAADRLRRPKSTSSVSTASSGGWGDDDETDSDAAGESPGGTKHIGGGPPGENEHVMITEPPSPENGETGGAANAAEVAKAQDFATPSPPPTHTGTGAPPAPTSAHALKREDHPVVPAPLHEQSRTPTPIAEAHARDNAPANVAADKAFLEMPGSFHRSGTEADAHEREHKKPHGAWQGLLSKLHLR